MPHPHTPDAASGTDRGESDPNWPNTDNADWQTVLKVVRGCALGWVPEARLIGNVRAGDIVHAIGEALAPASQAAPVAGVEGEKPGAYGIPGLPDRLSQSDQLRIFSAYYADRLPKKAVDELCALAEDWDQEVADAKLPPPGDAERLDLSTSPHSIQSEV